MNNLAVPRAAEVVPGAVVNIVLKADQRTGRQVNGTVRDVLTRGDHHRGIKVRLTDGRIGRVQSLASVASIASFSSPSASSGPPGVALAGSPTPPTPSTGEPDGTISQPHVRRSRYRDARREEQYDVPPAQVDLSAYVVPARRNGKNRNRKETDKPGSSARSEPATISNASGSAGDVISATATCPVCGAFEGDETAVAHHVAGHFE